MHCARSDMRKFGPQTLQRMSKRPRPECSEIQEKPQSDDSETSRGTGKRKPTALPGRALTHRELASDSRVTLFQGEYDSAALLEARRETELRAANYAELFRAVPPGRKRSDSKDTEGGEKGARGAEQDRRLEQNRASASISRLRRRAYIENLEDKVINLETEREAIRAQLVEEQDLNERLKKRLKESSPLDD
mmetsp:Transcript_26288/g.63925  ORF Transcript_26288/g.63925 Transcript_26288/m.63925 type:complete len:192 (+) Transcript_26288:178-753(+)